MVISANSPSLLGMLVYIWTLLISIFKVTNSVWNIRFLRKKMVWCFNREFFCCWPLCSCWVMGATQSELCFGHLPWTWKPLMKGNNSKIFSKDPEWIKNIIERNIVCRWLLKDCFIEHEELDWIFKTHEKLIKYLPAWQNNKVNCDIQKLSRLKRLSIEKITLVSHSLHTWEQKIASSPFSKRKTARKIFGILLQLRLRRLGTVRSDVNWYLWGWKQRDN